MLKMMIDYKENNVLIIFIGVLFIYSIVSLVWTEPKVLQDSQPTLQESCVTLARLAVKPERLSSWFKYCPTLPLDHLRCMIGPKWDSCDQRAPISHDQKQKKLTFFRSSWRGRL